MISRDDLSNCLNYLVPDAKYSFWPDDGVRDKIDMGNELPLIKMGGWVIDWVKSNSVPCPSWKEIKNLDMALVNKNHDDVCKKARNLNKSNDLTLVACYNIEKKLNPSLTFSDYIDSLEVESKEMQDN